MVFFTCNHCGESVKKPAVEKHYKFKCRKTPSLCCIDCLKDFHGEEYVAHTKCVTEEERYSAKGFVAKPSKNAGQKKQDTWVEIVRSILSSNEYEVSPAIRGLFQRLQSYDNVPRKKVKFENFVSNSLRVNKKQAEEVWGVLEKALDLLKATREAEQQSRKNDTGKTDTSATEGIASSEQNGTTPDDPTSTQKKKKRKHSENGHVNGENETETPLDIQEESTKKKKDKSAKKKKQNQEDHPETTADKPSEVVEQENTSKKSKKKKRSIEETVEVTPAEVQEPEKKKKKSKELQNAEQPATNGAPSHFDWNEITFTILAKHNNEMGLDKLKSKVLKKYLAHLQVDEITNKIEKTFKKKIKKSGLLVQDNIVKLNIK